MLYAIVKPVVRIALNWYYRSIAVAGPSRIPETGPVFLAVNHPNALVDALVVACSINRRVRFTAKATIFGNPLAAAFLRRAGVIPLRRAADEAKFVHGMEANATSANAVNSAGGDVDPSRNAISFRAVSEALAEGSVVVIFPEGRSHDEPALAPLRTGLARMALEAHDSLSVRHIQIIPVGLLFERKEEPRSRVLVQIGGAIDVDTFAESHGTDAHAVEALTALVTSQLSAVTINFETSEDAARISAVSETLANLLEPVASVASDGPPLSSVLSLVRRTDRVRESLAHASADSTLTVHAAEYEQRMRAFRARLAQHRISIEDIGIDLDATPGARFALREGARAALLLPVSWWGRATHFIPVRLARMLALRNAKARDEPAMNTLLFGLVLVLAAYAVETAIVWRVFGVWWALAFFVTLVPSASSDLRYGDLARRRTERMRAYFALRRDRALQRELLAEADWLRREAGAIEQMA